MMQVNMLEAKTNLSRLVRLIEEKEEDAIVLARGGTPVAKIVLFSQPDTSARIGAGNRRKDNRIPAGDPEDYLSFENLTKDDDEIAALFYGEEEDI